MSLSTHDIINIPKKPNGHNDAKAIGVSFVDWDIRWNFHDCPRVSESNNDKAVPIQKARYKWWYKIIVWWFLLLNEKSVSGDRSWIVQKEAQEIDIEILNKAIIMVSKYFVILISKGQLKKLHIMKYLLYLNPY
jgi:hypothetical protein